MCNGLGKRNGEKREVIIFQVQGNLVMFSLFAVIVNHSLGCSWAICDGSYSNGHENCKI